MTLAVDRIRGHSFIRDLLPKEDGLIVDLGMNEGYFSYEMQRKFSCKVVGVEANPLLVQAIVASDRLRPLNYAVSESRGDVSFNVNPENSEASSLTAGPRTQAVSVPCISFSDLVHTQGIRRIDLLKVDIEGAEVEMLQSTPAATLLLAKQISVEFHAFLDPEAVPAIKSILARLKKMGFMAIDFSRTYEDVLFINRHEVRLSPSSKVSLLFQKYRRGVLRMVWSRLSRILNCQ